MAELDVRHLPYMPLVIETLRKSRTWLRCRRQPELGFYLINLWMRAWQEVPAGSIEDDDDILADAAMCAPERWAELRDALLEGWESHNGRVSHRIVTDLATEAVTKIKQGKDRTAAARAKAAEARKLREEQAQEPKTKTLVSSENTEKSLPCSVTVSVTEDEGRSKKVEDKKESIPSSRGKRAMVDGEIRTEFDQKFWPGYPRKVDKQDALKAFIKARKLVPLDAILQALKSYSREVEGKEPQFTRHAARWLNAQPWGDAAEQVPAQSPAPVDDARWIKRLVYAREKAAWLTAWGPRPSQPGCGVPAHLLETNDGLIWTETEIAR